LETELHAAEDVLKNAQREAINITGRGKKNGNLQRKLNKFGKMRRFHLGLKKLRF